jgi:hypothetical protein
VALSAPATLSGPPLDLPWTLHSGRGIFGLDPVHSALAAWAALVGFTCLFVIFAALLSRWQLSRLDRKERLARALPTQQAITPAERVQLRVEAGELIRQAATAAAAARRLQSLVEETRARRDEAQQAREAAWRAFDAAQRAYEEALHTAGNPDDGTASTIALENSGNGHGHPNGNGNGSPASEEERREVSRAALAAYRRGDLTVDQLNVVFRQASGWDPVQELQAREIELRRTAESRARKLYQAAAAAERSASKAADVAAVAAHAIAEEAVEVAEDARLAREALNAAVRANVAPRRSTRKVPRQRRGQRAVSHAQ